MREDAGVTDEVEERVATPLVDEAIKKAAVAWVTVADGPAYALWCLPVDGALVVVTGPGEQSAPGLAEAGEAQVSLRGDHGGRIVTWPARVTRLMPGSEEWTTVAPLVAAKRLNAPGPSAALVDRWATEGCALNRLEPAGTPASGADLPADSLAEPPRDAPVVRATRKPFRLHRVRRR
ncbi:hypothetical protein DLE60_01615 [Micromonospora globispora]|uniref:Pyridoxamine 5'-phosphate oxidase n=1 Tax=Micromonospora globispora TaxID=1450148 RepID=A0A317JWU3_9ACTN|nr:hypothetical protein [Micromonospora globispora]PWU44002.1 hypothetical protein DLJ46_28315 [Micromonospora globispora]PWU62199.1 hypothetical protein DLE60_01615 [Micromonospora globispora]